MSTYTSVSVQEKVIMAQTDTVRSERINLRLSETGPKRRIEQAASVEGKTVSAFIVSSALENAGEDRSPSRDRRARP